MEGVGVCGVAYEFGEDRGASVDGVVPLLEDEDAGSFADDEAIASHVQGREAVAGSSLRVERARMDAKPATESGVTAASLPPQIITSASPRSRMRKASPMAWAPVVQAVEGVRLGPVAPYLIEICPAARLAMVALMKKGETRPGPEARSFACSRSMTSKAPIPLPT